MPDQQPNQFRIVGHITEDDRLLENDLENIRRELAQPITNEETVTTEQAIEDYHIFVCPHCNEESDWIMANAEMTGWNRGGTGVQHFIGVPLEEYNHVRISWDGVDEYNEEGDPTWECQNCNRVLTSEQVQTGIQTRQRPVIRRHSPRFDLTRTAVFDPVGKILAANLNERPTQILKPSEDRFKVLQGDLAHLRHKNDEVPDAYSPEVIAPNQVRESGYGYALTATCPECQYDIMVSLEDHNISCSHCNHEFQIPAKQRPHDAQNADQRRRRFESF